MIKLKAVIKEATYGSKFGYTDTELRDVKIQDVVGKKVKRVKVDSAKNVTVLSFDDGTYAIFDKRGDITMGKI